MMHWVVKYVLAKMVAQVRAMTVQISMNAKRTLTTALQILLAQTLSLVSLANQSADILALPEKDQLVETRLTAKAMGVHSRTSTNVPTTLTTVLPLRAEIMSCA